MNQQITSLTATFKTVAAFGTKYATDFPPASVGGQQFALVTAAVPSTATLAQVQASGGHQAKTGVRSKGVAYKLLHDDLKAINDGAHSLVLLGTTGLDGKFLMPRNHSTQDMLTAGRAFAVDAVPFTTQFISVGLPATFITQLTTDVGAYETAISAKGAGQLAQGGATGGIDDTTHAAAVALHVLNTVVTNKYKNDPTKLAEWVIASHVQKHTPVKRVEPTPTTTPATPAK